MSSTPVTPERPGRGLTGEGRRRYLQAMGIQAWRLREAGPAEGMPTVSVAPEWQALEDEVRVCNACEELAATRTRTVFGVGDREADWLVIGEAPGAEEDRRGEPFVGAAGQLLDAMLLALGLKRETVYIANVLKCRPPRNRDPRAEEVARCLGFLRRQVELVQPRVILCVGRIAAQNLLDSQDSLARLRGRAHRFNGIPVVVTYHPAYLLRTPQDKRKAWADLQFARQVAQGRIS